MAYREKKPYAVIVTKTKADVWTYFGGNLDGKYAHSLPCNKNKTDIICIKVSDGSTIALITHLKTFNNDFWLDIMNEER